MKNYENFMKLPAIMSSFAKFRKKKIKKLKIEIFFANKEKTIS